MQYLCIDIVSIHYVATLEDGSVFDSSYDRLVQWQTAAQHTDEPSIYLEGDHL